MKKKKWYASKTLWYNAILALVYIAQGLAGVSYIKPDVLVTVLAVGNGILRLMTDKGIGG